MDSPANANTHGVPNYPIYKLSGRTWRGKIKSKILSLNIRDIMVLSVFWLYFGYSVVFQRRNFELAFFTPGVSK